MQLWIRFAFFISAALLGLVLNGCAPGQNSSDEEKEPHFVVGQSKVNAMDFPGAVEAFEESLEVNPHSAAAHFELGWLYEQKVPDPAAAIYHYQQYLKLNPNANNATLIRQHIDACKQQLAADVLALPSASATQQQFEKLVEQNRQLQDEVNKWRAYYANQLSNAQPQNVSASQMPVSNAGIQNSQPQNVAVQNTTITPIHSTTIARSRTHTVASGETAMAISRKYSVKLNALQAANPGVNLNKLRVGQVLNIP